MASGAASHSRVDPWMSVNRNVTVPDGAPTAGNPPTGAVGAARDRSGHARTRSLQRPTGTAGSSLWTTLRSITADPSGNARAAANLSPDDGSGESSCVAVPYAQLRDTPVEAGAVPYP